MPFCPWRPCLWPLILTFKLIRARDLTRLPCGFNVNPFSCSPDISHTNKKSQTAPKNRTLSNSLRAVIIDAFYAQFTPPTRRNSTVSSLKFDVGGVNWALLTSFGTPACMPNIEVNGYFVRRLLSRHTDTVHRLLHTATKVVSKDTE